MMMLLVSRAIVETPKARRTREHAFYGQKALTQCGNTGSKDVLEHSPWISLGMYQNAVQLGLSARSFSIHMKFNMFNFKNI
jgi:hypothetical protein